MGAVTVTDGSGTCKSIVLVVLLFVLTNFLVGLAPPGQSG